MKAAVQQRYGPPAGVVAVQEVPAPVPAAGEVLMRVRAAGVNWADWSMTVGEPYLMRLGYGFRGPRKGIRGTDVAGTVVDVGKTVTDLRPGADVFGWGTAAFAELVAVPANQLVPLPVDVTHEEAAGLPQAGCVALQAMRDVARVAAGDRVLVNGASGGIGSLAVQIATTYGAHVTGVCSTENLDFVSSLGADEVLDYTQVDFTEGDARYDVIFDIADRHGLRERMRVMTPRGTLIPNSGVGGRWFGSVGRIVKAWVLSPFVGQRLRPFLSVTKRQDLITLSELVEAGDLTPVVGARYALGDAGLAIERAGSGHGRGKIVVTI